MPLNRAIAGLTIESPPSSRPGTARSEKPGDAPPLGKQPSFDVTGTNTFAAGDLKIRGESGLGGASLSDINYADLERLKVVGKGASGKVVLMRHRKGNGMQFALKEMAAIADSDSRQMAVNEIRIAHKHAKACGHLVATLDAYFIDGKIGILMEYMDGGSLVEALAAAQRKLPGLPPLPLGPVAIQMLTGLRYMHREMKQVHRDLKPANVLLSGDGSVKLSDFGVAKQLTSSDGFAMTQVGSTAYMSPERMKGEEYTYTSDVWAAGVILLEALLGEHPFPTTRHKNFVALFTAISNGDCPPPPADTPPDLAAQVASCLRLKESDRPSVDDLLGSPWLAPLGKGSVRQKVQQWLMASATCEMKAKSDANKQKAEKDEIDAVRAQAKAMAAKAIARSAMPASDEPANGGASSSLAPAASAPSAAGSST